MQKPFRAALWLSTTVQPASIRGSGKSLGHAKSLKTAREECMAAAATTGLVVPLSAEVHVVEPGVGP